ncbi:MAG: hypothetical protein KY453_06320 [Gemmatimonadetes bacterium]|nr:hypothetical protein [Gemmatimonadota bacterium]
MSPDSRESPERKDGVGPPASAAGRRRDGRPAELDRLPPPAFPPGSRRIAPRRSDRAVPARENGEGIPSDAFISPDDPFSAAQDVPEDAFIEPDEPIVRDDGVGREAFISPDEPLPSRTRRPTAPDPTDPFDAVVTGIDDDPHLEEDRRRSGAGATFDDPHVAALVERVGRLADALRERGEAGLRSTPDLSGFEATLRAYCVGWLAARREGSRDG